MEQTDPVYSIEEIPLSALRADPRNVNLSSDRGRASLKESVDAHGLGRSIVATRDLTVVAGNKTLETLETSRAKKVVVVRSHGDILLVHAREDWTTREDGDLSVDARRYALADNRTSELSYTPDPLLLSEHLAEIATHYAEQDDPLFATGYAADALVEIVDINAHDDLDPLVETFTDDERPRERFRIEIVVDQATLNDASLRAKLDRLCTEYQLSYRIKAA